MDFKAAWGKRKVERAESSNLKGPLRQILQTEGGRNPRMVLSC